MKPSYPPKWLYRLNLVAAVFSILALAFYLEDQKWELARWTANSALWMLIYTDLRFSK